MVVADFAPNPGRLGKSVNAVADEDESGSSRQ
jgi:hypothetical protein